MFGDFFAGKRVLLTGHTGFKGSWLLVWLRDMGAKVCGVSLAPETSLALFDLIGGENLCARHVTGDIRDAHLMRDVVAGFEPEIAIHMAAQALVLPAYADPAGTFATNVTGTANVLDALRHAKNLTHALVVTSDKVYANDGSGRAFVETDRLGGHDPYSASKAAAELVVESFRASYFEGKIALSAGRAGNVIGGGDWAAHRILPDAERAIAAGKPLTLRRPGAVRPWQHVLDPLAGYLTLIASGKSGAYNFGPDPANRRTVGDLIARFARGNGGAPATILENAPQPEEAPYLALSSEKAARELGWRPKLDFDRAVDAASSWYAARRGGARALDLVRAEIAAYLK
ncbi:MAG: CDP-glucose 4,6-dehydratase [Tagaea sp.]